MININQDVGCIVETQILQQMVWFDLDGQTLKSQSFILFITILSSGCFVFVRCSKVAIKLTKARLEVINKKRSAMLKFLNNDITDLLQNGLDYHAYGRVTSFLCLRNNLPGATIHLS